MNNFWDFEVWSWTILFGVLLGSLLAGNIVKKAIPLLRRSLIPTSVIGGALLLLVEWSYKMITGDVFFDGGLFGSQGHATLEIITYHALALGFIASTLKTTNRKVTKQRAREVFDTGVTTVSTYLLQAIFGLGITIVAANVIIGFFPAAGVLLPFGFGQGSGQALNWGSIYEGLGFAGGRSFGLTIAALGFLSAAIGGVIHLNIQKRRGKLVLSKRTDGSTYTEAVDPEDEIPLQESIDKITVQIALILVTYLLAFGMMFALGKIIKGENMRSIIYGFNFLFGVIAAILVKGILQFLLKRGWMKKKHTNNFLMTRASNFFFDVMIVAGVAAIRLDILENYWGIMLILGVVGLFITYVYNRIVAKVLFPDYVEEQFLAMYGMLTGTASTGIILLREVDGDFRTPASDNLVYQNLPAIVFGFPMMFLASLAPQKPILTLVIFALFFLAMNILLFRSKIFKKRKK